MYPAQRRYNARSMPEMRADVKNARRTLGMAVARGLLFSQLLTLYITPVFYLFMENVQKWLQGKFSPAKE